jgi:hypothetical protein
MVLSPSQGVLMSHKRIVALGVLLVVALSMPFYGHTWNHFMHVLGV